MNFFEHQEKAHKQSRWIILAFIGVALLIILAVDLIVMLLFSLSPIASNGAAQVAGGGIASFTNPEMWVENANMLIGSSAATGGLIGLASLGKIASLRSGGGKVAVAKYLCLGIVRLPVAQELFERIELCVGKFFSTDQTHTQTFFIVAINMCTNPVIRPP